MMWRVEWLANLGDTGTAVDTGLYTLDLVTGDLLVNGTWTSGRYYLGVSLFKDSMKVSGVYEVLRVYDTLPSTGSVTLTAAQISQPPAQPGGITVTHPGSSIDISWIDLSNTEEGFRVYRKKDGDADFTLMGSDLPPATTAAIDTDAMMYQAGSTVTYRVVAFNDFGESPYAELSYRLLPAFSGGFPFTEEGFDSYYGVQLNWGAVIGADTLELWMGPDAGSMSFKTSLGPSALGYFVPAVDLAPESTYYWELRAMNTTGIVDSTSMTGALFFGTRDESWYVVPTLGSDTAKGSVDAPLSTIQEALNRMPASGGIIRLGAEAGGALFNEALTLDKPVVMEGNWNDYFSMQDKVTNKTTLSSSASQSTITIASGASVELRNLRVENAFDDPTKNNYAVWVSNGNLMVKDSEISAGSAQAQRGGAFQLSGISNLTLLGNQIWAGESSNDRGRLRHRCARNVFRPADCRRS